MNSVKEKLSRAGDWIRRHLFILLCLLCAIMCYAIVGMDLVWTPMPLWAGAALCAGTVVCAVFMWKKERERNLVRIVVSIFAGCSVAFCILGSFFNPYWNSIVIRGADRYTDPMNAVLSYREAKEDLDAAYGYLRKVHPALADGVPEEVRKNYESADETLENASQIDVAMLMGEIEKMLSPLEDAHTYVNFNTEEPGMLRFAEAHEKAGDRMYSVNGVPLTQILEEQGDKLSYETLEWGLLRLEDFLSTLDGLAYFGFPTDAAVTYEYETPEGVRITEIAEADDFHSLEEYRQTLENDEDAPTVFFEADKDKNLAVLTLNACANDTNYRSALQNMFAQVRDEEIGNVALDLRANGGGDPSVTAQFLQYLTARSYKRGASESRLGPWMRRVEQTTVENLRRTDYMFDGDLYVLTSPATFGAGAEFAEILADNGLAKLVGETPGSNPNGYGEITQFILPNSGLIEQISTSRYYRIDGKEGSLEPDIPSDDALEALESVIS